MRIPTIIALALAMFAVSGSAASAGETEEIKTKGGEVIFFDFDNTIRATDALPDGKSVRAYLHWSSTESASVLDKKFDSKSASKPLKIREGTTVWLQMCYVKKGVDVQCSKSQRAEA
jgi:hypothetical protein